MGDPGLGSEGSLEPSEWSVKGQGEAHLQCPAVPLHCAGFSYISLCLILINELRVRDSLVHSMEKYFWSSYYVSSIVLGTEY